MSYPAGEEQTCGGGFKIQWIVAIYGIEMQKITAMV
jgi:hypothetical protein